MTAPVVALTATTKMIEGLPRVRLNEAYVDAVRAAGLIPLIVPPLEPAELESIIATVDGVVLTGGEDVDPAEFGAPSGRRTQPAHTRRDKCELALVHLAREHRIPTLAICRGIQVMNVAFGGSLIQDIPSEHPSDIDHDRPDDRTDRVHPVEVERHSRLARAMAATHITVNTSHHQAVDRVGEGLRISARAPDGIIEGVEWPSDDWWMLGVQWHPEELVHDAREWDRGLFKAFADEVRR
jgi:putative glutamine amidotransferase